MPIGVKKGDSRLKKKQVRGYPDYGAGEGNSAGEAETDEFGKRKQKKPPSRKIPTHIDKALRGERT
jgi:hypothetical protein